MTGAQAEAMAAGAELQRIVSAREAASAQNCTTLPPGYLAQRALLAEAAERLLAEFPLSAANAALALKIEEALA